MKSLLILILSLSATAFAGPGSTGGGDRCEERFKTIAQDLRSWIVAGGPEARDLKLPEGLSVAVYSSLIMEQISKARITCVGPKDIGYPVVVDGKAKECINFVDKENVTRIVCDREKFYSGLATPDNDSSQYRLVHHEYASLAGIEKPTQDDSNYLISSQMSGALETQLVKKLSIQKVKSVTQDRQFNQLPERMQLHVFAPTTVFAETKWLNFEGTEKIDHCSMRVGPLTGDWTFTPGSYDIRVTRMSPRSGWENEEEGRSGEMMIEFHFANSDFERHIFCTPRVTTKVKKGLFSDTKEVIYPENYRLLSEINKVLQSKGMELVVP